MTDNINTKKFGSTNILTDEEKASYRKFAHRIHELPNTDLFKLYSNMASDELTSEEQDIVAWEFRLREVKAMKAKSNTNTLTDYTVDETHKEIPYAEDSLYKDEFRAAEKNRMQGMDEALLERSKQIIENTPTRINSNNLHNVFGGGINMMTKKYIVEDNNGSEIVVNNREIQEHFRKMYMKRMSDICGINYLEYDESPDIEYLDNNPMKQVSQSELNNNSSSLDMSDYEDD